MFKLENDPTKEHRFFCKKYFLKWFFRILIFSKASNVTWANSMYEVFADGSFAVAVVPPPFVQVYALLTRLFYKFIS